MPTSSVNDNRSHMMSEYRDTRKNVSFTRGCGLQILFYHDDCHTLLNPGQLPGCLGFLFTASLLYRYRYLHPPPITTIPNSLKSTMVLPVLAASTAAATLAQARRSCVDCSYPGLLRRRASAITSRNVGATSGSSPNYGSIQSLLQLVLPHLRRRQPPLTELRVGTTRRYPAAPSNHHPPAHSMNHHRHGFNHCICVVPKSSTTLSRASFSSSSKSGPPPPPPSSSETEQTFAHTAAVQVEEEDENKSTANENDTIEILVTTPGTGDLTIPGAEKGGRKLALVFTCTVCNTRSAKQFTEQAYNHGVVIVTCPGCQRQHLIADRLGYFQDGAFDLDTIAAQTGQTFKRVTDRNSDGGGIVQITLEDLVGKDKMKELLQSAQGKKGGVDDST